MSLKKRTYQPNDPRQLIFAIRNRDFSRVQYLLESYPVDVNGHDSKGVTAIHEAALDGQVGANPASQLLAAPKHNYECKQYSYYS